MRLLAWNIFQLPPSHEGEHARRSARNAGIYFNSRPRMRANCTRAATADGQKKFQLPPSHEGERELARVAFASMPISTPALA